MSLNSKGYIEALYAKAVMGKGPNAGRVLFHKCSSVVWMLLLIPSWLWWRDSVFWVIAISIYANIKSDWAAAEAADDSTLMCELEKIMSELTELREEVKDLREWYEG